MVRFNDFCRRIKHGLRSFIKQLGLGSCHCISSRNSARFIGQCSGRRAKIASSALAVFTSPKRFASYVHGRVTLILVRCLHCGALPTFVACTGALDARQQTSLFAGLRFAASVPPCVDGADACPRSLGNLRRRELSGGASQLFAKIRHGITSVRLGYLESCLVRHHEPKQAFCRPTSRP